VQPCRQIYLAVWAIMGVLFLGACGDSAGAKNIVPTPELLPSPATVPTATSADNTAAEWEQIRSWDGLRSAMEEMSTERSRRG